MKLLTKTNIYTSFATIVLFALGVFIVYQVILLTIDRDADQRLLIAKEEVIKSLKEGIEPQEFLSNIGPKIYVRKIKKQTIFNNQFIEYREKGFDPSEKDGVITQRELLFQVLVDHKFYEATVCISLTEGKEIGQYISGVVLIFLVASFFILFLLNRVISDFIWSPFNDTLSKIKTWNIKKNTKLNFRETDIDEFHLLNDTLNDLTQQIQSDYYNLKEFTENVSHEAQTPLAIINTKIELLMQQSSNFSEKQQELLMQIYRATQRLYKLNEALILLTRIENKQFIETSEVDLIEAINEKLEVLEDFVEAKQIKIIKEFNSNIKKELNSVLLTILLNNLFINAIKYNLEEGGTIKITVDENSFSVENTSPRDKIDRQFIFERFNKSSSGSLGVGLSLIKKIVDFYNWQVTYSHKDGIHKFKIYM